MSGEIILSRRVDEYVPENRWVASLSNGETIFEDVRPINPTWERLAEYVIQKNLSITSMRIQVAGLTLNVPKNQEGYIQKKKMWTTGATSGKCLCAGYSQGGLAVIDEVGEDKSSRRIRCLDPGEPWTIYRLDVRKKRELLLK